MDGARSDKMLHCTGSICSKRQGIHRRAPLLVWLDSLLRSGERRCGGNLNQQEFLRQTMVRADDSQRRRRKRYEKFDCESSRGIVLFVHEMSFLEG